MKLDRTAAVARCALCTIMLAAPALAQTTGGTASPAPVTSAPGLSTPGRDVFLASPETYAPTYDSPSSDGLFVPGLLSVYGPGPAGIPYLPVPWQVTLPTAVLTADAVPAAAVPAAPVVPPARDIPPYVAGTPGTPKTFYVIPGCYAGTARPSGGTLPAGCSLDRLREIPPATTQP